MYRILLITISLILSQPLFASTLIGSIVPPYPEGLKTTRAACIPQVQVLGHEKFCSFAVNVLQEVGKESFVLIVEKQIGRKGENAIWQITDQMNWPKQPENTHVSLGGCRRNGIVDHAIVALVVVADEPWFKAANWAMKIDFKNGKLREISPEGIECENEY